mmetsp:Transcript_11127/g.30868  ORF Transcript_11127/g.30868 Transcript_11127/m.30868 type:complete len:120 (+) Transcript_11127:307-666(+)
MADEGSSEDEDYDPTRQDEEDLVEKPAKRSRHRFIDDTGLLVHGRCMLQSCRMRMTKMRMRRMKKEETGMTKETTSFSMTRQLSAKIVGSMLSAGRRKKSDWKTRCELHGRVMRVAALI